MLADTFAVSQNIKHIDILQSFHYHKNCYPILQGRFALLKVNQTLTLLVTRMISRDVYLKKEFLSRQLIWYLI